CVTENLAIGLSSKRIADLIETGVETHASLHNLAKLIGRLSVECYFRKTVLAKEYLRPQYWTIAARCQRSDGIRCRIFKPFQSDQDERPLHSEFGELVAADHLDRRRADRPKKRLVITQRALVVTQ